MAKLGSSVTEFIRGESVHAKLNHLTLMELNNIRPLLPNAMNQVQRLIKNENNVTVVNSQDF